MVTLVLCALTKNGRPGEGGEAAIINKTLKSLYVVKFEFTIYGECKILLLRMVRGSVDNTASENAPITVTQWAMVGYFEHCSSIGEVAYLEVSVSHTNE